MGKVLPARIVLIVSLLCAGLHALGKLSAAQLKTALSGLEKIETGRPKKN